VGTVPKPMSARTRPGLATCGCWSDPTTPRAHAPPPGNGKGSQLGSLQHDSAPCEMNTAAWLPAQKTRLVVGSVICRRVVLRPPTIALARAHPLSFLSLLLVLFLILLASASSVTGLGSGQQQLKSTRGKQAAGLWCRDWASGGFCCRMQLGCAARHLQAPCAAETYHSHASNLVCNSSEPQLASHASLSLSVKRARERAE
jgi:hypothetical protein